MAGFSSVTSRCRGGSFAANHYADPGDRLNLGGTSPTIGIDFPAASVAARSWSTWTIYSYRCVPSGIGCQPNTDRCN